MITEEVSTTFLGRPLTIRMSLFEDKCAECGTDILLSVLPDGIFFCEPCRYKRFMQEMETKFEVDEPRCKWSS